MFWLDIIVYTLKKFNQKFDITGTQNFIAVIHDID
jgi:hypothetical protein